VKGTINRISTGFTQISNDVIWDMDPLLSLTAFRLYVVLCKMGDKNNQSFPSYATLRAKCRIGSDATIRKAMNELVEVGLLHVQPRIRPGFKEKTTNCYTVFNTPKIKKPADPINAPVCSKCGCAFTESSINKELFVASEGSTPCSSITVEPSTVIEKPSTAIEEKKELLNKTYLSLSVCPSDSPTETDGRTDKKTVQAHEETPTVQLTEYEETVKQNIEYDALIDTENPELVNNFVDIIVDVLATKSNTVRINGEDKPRELVKSAFMKLGYADMEVALTKYTGVKKRVKRTKEYIVTLLYNQKLEGEAYLANFANSARPQRE